jgi:hypothetical protein
MDPEHFGLSIPYSRVAPEPDVLSAVAARRDDGGHRGPGRVGPRRGPGLLGGLGQLEAAAGAGAVRTRFVAPLSRGARPGA